MKNIDKEVNELDGDKLISEAIKLAAAILARKNELTPLQFNECLSRAEKIVQNARQPGCDPKGVNHG